MKYIGMGFMAAIGWKTGAFVFDVIVSVLHESLPSKLKKSKSSYKSYH